MEKNKFNDILIRGLRNVGFIDKIHTTEKLTREDSLDLYYELLSPISREINLDLSINIFIDMEW